MLKERRDAANSVASQLFAAEAAIDDALAKLGTLVTGLTTARSDARLSLVVGNEAYGHLGEAVTALVNSRSSVVALHHELDEVKNGIGLRNIKIVGTGDAGKIFETRGTNDETVTSEQAAA